MDFSCEMELQEIMTCGSQNIKQIVSFTAVPISHHYQSFFCASLLLPLKSPSYLSQFTSVVCNPGPPLSMLDFPQVSPRIYLLLCDGMSHATISITRSCLSYAVKTGAKVNSIVMNSQLLQNDLLTFHLLFN